MKNTEVRAYRMFSVQGTRGFTRASYWTQVDRRVTRSRPNGPATAFAQQVVLNGGLRAPLLAC